MFPLLRLALGPLWVFWGLSGASWGLPFPLLGRRGRLGSFLGVSRAVFGTSWGHLVWSEAISSVMGPPWGHLGSPEYIGPFWDFLGQFEEGTPGCLELYWVRLGSVLGHPGHSCGHPGPCWGAAKTPDW